MKERKTSPDLSSFLYFSSLIGSHGEKNMDEYTPTDIPAKGKKGKVSEKKASPEKKKAKSPPVRLNDEDISILREQVLNLEKMVNVLPDCAKTRSLKINVGNLKKKLTPKGKSLLREMVSGEE